MWCHRQNNFIYPNKKQFPPHKNYSTNDLLSEYCVSDNFYYLTNDSISRQNLWKEGSHLNDVGNILAENFISYVNKFVLTRTNSFCLKELPVYPQIYKDHASPYLHNWIPKNFQSYYSLRTTNDIPLFRVTHGLFKSSFFTSTTIEWNNLDYHLRNAPSISVFKQNILKIFV